VWDAELAGAETVADEFGLGRLESVTPLGGSGQDVVKLTAAAGVFVVKPADRTVEPELYERVARTLNRSGIRQAMPRRTMAGALVSASGHTVQEFLAGRAALTPTPAQTAATMRQVAAYHAMLRTVPSPVSLRPTAACGAGWQAPSTWCGNCPGC
jgi:hypothetical protein